MVIIRAAVILKLDLILMALICPLFVSSFYIFGFFYGPLPASCVSVNSTWFIRSALDQLPQTLHFIIMWVWFFFSRMGNLTSSHPRGLSSTACLQYVQVRPATYKQLVTLLGMVAAVGLCVTCFQLCGSHRLMYFFFYGYTTTTYSVCLIQYMFYLKTFELNICHAAHLEVTCVNTRVHKQI